MNTRIFYSNCNPGAALGIGCYIYADAFGNPLAGYTHVFMQANWYVNQYTGQITGYSTEQC